jgi:hypothetical protein
VAAHPARASGRSPISIDKVLRFRQAGHCCPPRPERTNRAFPHGSALAADRGPMGFLVTNRDPHGFLDKGDVMIHRPYLVAWSVGSDWRTRRLRLVVHLDEGAGRHEA